MHTGYKELDDAIQGIDRQGAIGVEEKEDIGVDHPGSKIASPGWSTSRLLHDLDPKLARHNQGRIGATVIHHHHVLLGDTRPENALQALTYSLAGVECWDNHCQRLGGVGGKHGRDGTVGGWLGSLVRLRRAGGCA